MILKSEILDKLKKKSIKSGGHNGISYLEIKREFGEVKELLNQMYKEKEITTYEGVRGKFIKII